MPPVTGAVLWVIPGTTPEQLRHIPDGVTVREIPSDGPLPDAGTRGDIVIPHVRRSLLRDLLVRLDNLRVIQTLSAGVDHYVDLVPKGVLICDAAGVHDIPVAEWVIAAILAMQRDLPRYVTAQNKAEWSPSLDPAHEVNGMRALIVGHGSIGRAVAERLRAFGAFVDGVALHPRDDAHGIDSLDALLPDADAVIVLLPLTPQTRRLVDAAFIARMKRQALLVNAGRGEVADTDAIVKAAREGRIRAALDVVDPEPLPGDHPLWSTKGVLLTPHVAGSSTAFLDRAWRLVGEQVRRYIDGEPLYNVVREGY